MTQNSKVPSQVSEVRYKNFASDLHDLPIAIVNRIERERWGALKVQHEGLPTLLTHIVRVAGVTWESIEVLVIEKRHGAQLPSRHAVTVAPLERTFLDSLMAIVFLFEDPKDRTDWYYRSGWREAADRQSLFSTHFGTQPEWAGFLADHQAWVDSHNADFGITPQERADPKLATARWAKQGNWWPNPGKMKRLATGATADFLTLLDLWFYGQLSGDSHLSYMGLVRRGGVLQPQHDGPTRGQYRSTATLSALSLYVALLSEVIAAASLPFEAGRVIRIWEELRVQFTADLLWTKRYAALLAGVQ